MPEVLYCWSLTLIASFLVQLIRFSNEEAIANMQSYKAGLAKALNSREDSLRSGTCQAEIAAGRKQQAAAVKWLLDISICMIR